MQGMARSSLFVNIVHKLEANRKTHALPLNRFVTGPQQILFHRSRFCFIPFINFEKGPGCEFVRPSAKAADTQKKRRHPFFQMVSSAICFGSFLILLTPHIRYNTQIRLHFFCTTLRRHCTMDTAIQPRQKLPSKLSAATARYERLKQKEKEKRVATEVSNAERRVQHGACEQGGANDMDGEGKGLLAFGDNTLQSHTNANED
jgi:hypothetical protein